MAEGFAALILSHGRPDRVLTYRALRRAGYSGPIWILIDDEDPTGDAYRQRFPGEVVMFHKAEAARRFDPMDQSQDRRTVVYARVASFAIAEELGLSHFIQLDDDYNSFHHRLRYRDAPEQWQARQLKARPVRDMDAVLAALVQLLEDTGALTVAMGQSGEMIGGVNASLAVMGLKRKAMNSFVCRSDRPIPFMGRLNEDVTAYCLWGSRGELFFTVSAVTLAQTMTQQAAGGMTETYQDSGTYVKSFYTVMACPSFVSIRGIGTAERRIHHFIDWPHAVPKILAPELRKEGGSPPPPLLSMKPSDAFALYLSRLREIGGVDVERVRREAERILREVKAPAAARKGIQPGELEQRWYASLAAGEPDWGIYDSDDYLAEAWASWQGYSRGYLRAIRKLLLPELRAVTTVLDLGCGHGFSSASWRELLPGARIIGTQLPGKQWAIASAIAAGWGWELREGFAGIRADLAFASEYFEHFPDPFAHLRELIAETSPRWLIHASTFASPSPGHFPAYGPQQLGGRAASAAFDGLLRELGYAKQRTGMWNDRPAVWRRTDG